MLESRKIVLRETTLIAAGEAVCCGIMSAAIDGIICAESLIESLR